MNGLHLTAGLLGCSRDAPSMTEPGARRALCLAAIAQAGLQAVGEVFHGFAAAGAGPASEGASGIAGAVLPAESHLAIHTWPEFGCVTLDAFVCNVGTDNSMRGHALLEALIPVLAPSGVERQSLRRGLHAPRATPAANAAHACPLAQ
jgi:S-adenosylmethionine decarboxylase